MLTLRKIDYDTLSAVTALHVADSQRGFVADNTLSIMEAYIALSKHEVALPYALYAGDTAVGFLMLGYGRADFEDEPQIAGEGVYTIWRLMIDQRYQHRGYGREAMQEALRLIRSGPCGPARAVWLSYEPENLAARQLYHSLDFEENGETCGNEIVAVLSLEEEDQ